MTIQQEATNIINSLPDDSVQLILEMMKKMIQPVSLNNRPVNKRFGVAKGYLYECNNFDKHNDEIADLFEVNKE